MPIAKLVINTVSSEENTACKSLKMIKSKEDLETIGNSELINTHFQFLFKVRNSSGKI